MNEHLATSPRAPRRASPTGSASRRPAAPRFAETKRADAPAQPRHGVRGGGLPEHRRVLDQEARDGDDPGRHLHARLRLLQRQDRACRARSIRWSRSMSPMPRPSWGWSISSSPRSIATICPMAARSQFVKVIEALRRDTPNDDDRDPDARFPQQGARPRSSRSSRRGPTSTITISRRCRGSIRRSARARAIMPRCGCWRASSGSIRRSSPSRA